MAISKYSRSIKMPQYTPRSIEEYMMVPKASTEALLGSQEALSNMLFDKNLLPKDKAKLQEIIDPFSQRIDALSEKVAKGDISPNTLMDLNVLSSDYRRLVSPTGTYGRAATNYDLAMDYVKTAAKTYDQDPLIAQAAATEYINSFSTYGDEGFDNGVTFVGNAMPSFVDTQEYITNLAKNVSADRFAVYLDAEGKAMLQQPGMNYTLYDLLGHIDQKNAGKIQQLIFDTAKVDPDFVKSYNFQMKYQGLPSLFTTEKDAKGEEKYILNPATPFYQMTNALAKGMSSRKESFQDTTPTESKTTKISGGGDVEPPVAKTSELNDIQVFRDNYVAVQSYIAIADQKMQLVTSDPESASNLTGLMNTDESFFDFENSTAGINQARQNFYGGVYDFIANLNNPGVSKDQAIQAFLNKNPQVDKEQFVQYISNENNLNYLLTAADAFASKDTADAQSSLYEANVDAEYQEIINAFGSQEELNSKLGLPGTGLRILPITRNQFIKQFFKNTDFEKREKAIYENNLRFLITGGREAYLDAVNQDYAKLKEEIKAKYAGNSAVINILDNFNLEQGATESYVNRIADNFKEEVFDNKELNQRVTQSNISYDIPDVPDLENDRNNLLGRIVDNAATVNTVGGTTLLDALEKAGIKKGIYDKDNYQLNIIPQGGRNYIQMVFTNDEGKSLAFVMQLAGDKNIAAEKFIRKVVNNPKFLEQTSTSTSAMLINLNDRLFQTGMTPQYNQLRLAKPGENIQVTVGFGVAQVDVVKGTVNKKSYNITMPNGTKKSMDTAEEVMNYILSN